MWFRNKKKKLGQELTNLKKRWPNANMGGSEPITYLHSQGVSAASIVESKRIDIRDNGAGYEYTVQKPDGEYYMFFVSFLGDSPIPNTGNEGEPMISGVSFRSGKK